MYMQICRCPDVSESPAARVSCHAVSASPVVTALMYCKAPHVCAGPLYEVGHLQTNLFLRCRSCSLGSPGYPDGLITTTEFSLQTNCL
jgi:hypothetical protein